MDKVVPRGTRRRRLAVRMAKAVRPDRPPKSVGEERDTLKSTWARNDPDTLDNYLVTGFQNPQVNAQSILARHHLIRQLFGAAFDDLMHAELEHCVTATKALRKRAKELGVPMGTSVDETRRAEVLEVNKVIADWQDTYERRWAAELATRSAEPLRVLEFACGSANDYRYFDSYGLARFLRYTGVDLNDHNIANAKRRFPDVDFEVHSVLDLPYRDRSYDYVVVFDLFEHMSIDAMERAVREACRLADRGVVLTFFSMADDPEHQVRPVRRYYWNVLSRQKVQQLVEESFGPVQAIEIRDLIRAEFGYTGSYNKNAWTLTASRAD